MSSSQLPVRSWVGIGIIVLAALAAIIMGSLAWTMKDRAAKSSATLAGGLSFQLVTPLLWSASQGFFSIPMTLPDGSKTSAAFDTGSSGLILNNVPTSALTASTPVPALSGSGNCTSTVSYVSQSNVVTQYDMTITFPRVDVGQVKAVTVSDSITTTYSPGASLVINNFPVGVVTSSTGTGPSANVFGMSSVLVSSTVSGDGTTSSKDSYTAAGVPKAPKGVTYLLPYCQTSTKPAFESPMLQAVSVVNAGLAGQNPHDADATPNPGGGITGTTNVWCMGLHQNAGFVLFAAMSLNAMPASARTTTALVPKVPNAPAGLTSTPMRYYIVKVASATLGGSPVPGFPKYLMVDTGTTNVLLPNKSGSAIAGSSQTCTITLQGVCSSACGKTQASQNPVLTFPPGSSPDASMFQDMSDAVASGFSSAQDLGILGVRGLMGRFLQFNLTDQTLQFADLSALIASGL